ncbi:MAG: nucleotide exchange factor GrpE [Candidatus Omnitrophota bacterium]|nr:nucleotide exchange factor GrpE [Candidatus Omnitrophota bacterium]
MTPKDEVKEDADKPEEVTDKPQEVSDTPKEVVLEHKEYEELLSAIKELEEHKDKFLRSAADFENAKKRLARDREDFLKFGQESLLRSLLNVLANFERALQHAKESPGQEALVSGVEMVYKQLADILKIQGLKRLETKDAAFDPHLHEAVGYVEEEGKEDTIVDEIEPGYMIHDRLLRAAKVRVRVAPKKK